MENYIEGSFTNRNKKLFIQGLGLFGAAGLFFSIYKIINLADLSTLFDNIIVLILLVIIFPKSVTLPSGSVWRPAIGLIIYSSIVYPFHDSVFIVFVAMLIAKFKSRNSWSNLFISFGHLAIGILATRLVVTALSPYFGYDLPQAFIWFFIALAIHFLVNRLISAVIVSFRKKKHFIDQVKLIKNDLNWGYVSTYLISMGMAFMYHAYKNWGVLVMVLLLYSIYFSVLYFKKANDLEHIYLSDALTGAENRGAWEFFKVSYHAKGSPGTLLIVDLDYFKGINDQWGHDIGDQILCETVSCLKGIYPNRGRVFRFGGDEFILYIPHNKNEQFAVQQMITKIINAKNKEWAERSFIVAMSLGMEFISSNEMNLDQVFIHIDKEMYENKSIRRLRQIW